MFSFNENNVHHILMKQTELQAMTTMLKLLKSLEFKSDQGEFRLFTFDVDAMVA